MDKLKQQILKKIPKTPTAALIADALGEPRPRVSRALKAMVAAGTVTKTGNTRATTYAIAA